MSTTDHVTPTHDTQHTKTTGPSPNQAVIGGSSAPATRVRYARRKGVIGLGVALIATCGVGAWWLADQSSDTIQVVAIANDVSRGELIEDSDLTTVAVSLDPALDAVSADRIDELVGQRAAADLTKGTLLAAAAVTADLVPGAGQTVVGVAVNPNQLPAEPITPGDPIRIVDTPNQGDDPPASSPATIAATVVSVAHAETGQIVVNVIVNHDVAPDLAARVATGRISIVLDSANAGGDT